jgi:hypothetical protein
MSNGQRSSNVALLFTVAVWEHPGPTSAVQQQTLQTCNLQKLAKSVCCYL